MLHAQKTLNVDLSYVKGQFTPKNVIIILVVVTLGKKGPLSNEVCVRCALYSTSLHYGHFKTKQFLLASAVNQLRNLHGFVNLSPSQEILVLSDSCWNDRIPFTKIWQTTVNIISPLLIFFCRTLKNVSAFFFHTVKVNGVQKFQDPKIELIQHKSNPNNSSLLKWYDQWTKWLFALKSNQI